MNRALDAPAAQAISRQFVEVIIAPQITPDAMAVFAGKGNIRVLEVPLAAGANPFDLKRVGGGVLVQTPDGMNVAATQLKTVTRCKPTDAQLADLLFAWRVAKFVKSNAIVFCGNGQRLGVGAGQMSRVDSSRIAVWKANEPASRCRALSSAVTLSSRSRTA